MKRGGCLICNELMEYKHLIKEDAYLIHCIRCGYYYITGTLFSILQDNSSITKQHKFFLSKRQRANISGYLLENQRFKINEININQLKEIYSPSFHEKADKILLFLEQKTEFAGESFKEGISWISAGWCLNKNELREILRYLESCNFIMGMVDFQIAPKGWAHLETLKKVSLDSNQCFVAMWFDDKMQPIYDKAISQGIIDAGYKPHRVDQREHNGKIDDEIIAQIRRSRFILADFTGHRGGMYYEAGFAAGLGLEVILSCRKDHMKDLHFDIRQYNCIEWEPDKLEDFRKRIKNRIERVFGQGTYQLQNN